MDKTKIRVILFMVIISTVLALVYLYPSSKQTVQKGIADMKTANLESERVVNLDGDWEFYWDKLLTPESFTGETQENTEYVKVPSNWANTKGKQKYSSEGYATYRLKIVNIPRDTFFGLKKENIRTASKVFVNGRLLLEDGIPAESKMQSTISNRPQIVFFELESSEAEIVIQVANFDYINAGISNSIYFGYQDDLMRMHFKQNLMEAIVVVILLLIGGACLVFYFVQDRRKKRQTLVLSVALSCLFFALANGFISERFFINIFPLTRYETIFKLYYCSVYSFMIAILFFVNRTSDIFLKTWIRNALSIVFGSYLLVVLLTPIRFYIGASGYYMILDIAVLMVLFVRVFYLYLRKSESVIGINTHTTLLIALFAINIYTFDNVVFSLGIRKNMNIGLVSTVLFNILLLIMLTLHYAEASRQKQEMAVKLVENFYALDKKEEALKRNEIAFLQAQIKPHFLFNAMSSIIGLCYTDGDRAGNLLQELMNFLKASFDFDTNRNYITIESEINLIETFVKIQKERFGDRIQMTYRVEPEVMDFKIIPLVIEPLIENAIQHGILKNRLGGTVKLTIEKRGQNLYIEVEDDGRGIHKEFIQLEMSSQTETKSGVGLKNINSRLKMFYSREIQIQILERGTRVWFEIPATNEVT